MKINIKFIMALCLILFSCKNNENTLLNKSTNEKINNNEILQRKISKLEQLTALRGPIAAYDSFLGQPTGWTIYKNISNNYSPEIIENEFYKTNSSIAKIYLYWALREKNWDNLSIVYNSLMERGNEKITFVNGCIAWGEFPLEFIAEMNLREKEILYEVVTIDESTVILKMIE